MGKNKRTCINCEHAAEIYDDVIFCEREYTYVLHMHICTKFSQYVKGRSPSRKIIKDGKK